jgi:hypothetical protein
MKLYQSREHQGKWIAWSEETGWVVFPATVNGWVQRKPGRGLDPMHLRQVPAHLAAGTGIGAPQDYSQAA